MQLELEFIVQPVDRQKVMAKLKHEVECGVALNKIFGVFSSAEIVEVENDNPARG
jgi:hypothetical protein